MENQPNIYKKCNGCLKEFLVTTEFWHKTKSTKDGLHTKCKECKNEYAKQYRKQNLDKIKKKSKIFRDNNKETIIKRKKEDYRKHIVSYKKRSKRWRENNIERDVKSKYIRYIEKIEEIKEYNNSYYRNNKDRIKKNVSNWIKNNKNKFKAIQARRRDRKNNLDCDISDVFILVVKKSFDNVCFKCKTKKDLCLDHHFPLSKGFGMNAKNVVLLCKSCNSSKYNKMPCDFYTEDELNNINKIFDIIEVSLQCLSA